MLSSSFFFVPRSLLFCCLPIYRIALEGPSSVLSPPILPCSLYHSLTRPHSFFSCFPQLFIVGELSFTLHFAQRLSIYQSCIFAFFLFHFPLCLFPFDDGVVLQICLPGLPIVVGSSSSFSLTRNPIIISILLCAILFVPLLCIFLKPHVPLLFPYATRRSFVFFFFFNARY